MFDQLDLILPQWIAEERHARRALDPKASDELAARGVTRKEDGTPYASRQGCIVAVEPKPKSGAMRCVAVDAVLREDRTYVTPIGLLCVVGDGARRQAPKNHDKENDADVRHELRQSLRSAKNQTTRKRSYIQDSTSFNSWRPDSWTWPPMRAVTVEKEPQTSGTLPTQSPKSYDL